MKMAMKQMVYPDQIILTLANVKLNGAEFGPGPPPVITISALDIPNKLSSVSAC